MLKLDSSMKLALSKLAAGFLVLTADSTGAWAKSRAPLYEPRANFRVLLRDPELVDSMAMHCRTPDLDEKLDKLNCQFRQVVVTKREKSFEDIDQAGQEMRTKLKDPAAFKKALSYCSDSLTYIRETSALTSNKHKALALEHQKAFSATACACKTPDCFVNAFIAEEKRTRNSCSIMATAFDAEFKRQSENRWVSVSGPEGNCGTILTLVLVYNPADDAWEFTQKRVITVPSEPLCPQTLESASRAFSHHRYLHDAEIGCDTISTIIP